MKRVDIDEFNNKYKNVRLQLQKDFEDELIIDKKSFCYQANKFYLWLKFIFIICINALKKIAKSAYIFSYNYIWPIIIFSFNYISPFITPVTILTLLLPAMLSILIFLTFILNIFVK